MPSVFSKIIDGELPGRFVWEDEQAVAFLSINPITDGHTLVVPRKEVDHWLDLDDDLWLHLSTVAKRVGEGIQHAYDPPRVGEMIAGFEVAHVHIHVLQTAGLDDLAFEKARTDVEDAELDEEAERIRGALRELGYDEVSDR